MNSTAEFQKAKTETEASRARLHEALHEVELKMDRLIDKMHAPERLAKKYPFLNAALFLILGFVIGSQLPTEREPLRKL